MQLAVLLQFDARCIQGLKLIALTLLPVAPRILLAHDSLTLGLSHAFTAISCLIHVFHVVIEEARQLLMNTLLVLREFTLLLSNCLEATLSEKLIARTINS